VTKSPAGDRRTVKPTQLTLRPERLLSRKTAASHEKAPDDAGAFTLDFGLSQ
jgi:hypothetical protein